MRHKDMEFEWDDGNTTKILKRFSLLQVEEFFEQELLYRDDPQHSLEETREIAIGIGPEGKFMYVCFTIRHNKIRVISARYMRDKEVKKYEEFKKNKA